MITWLKRPCENATCEVVKHELSRKEPQGICKGTRRPSLELVVEEEEPAIYKSQLSIFWIFERRLHHLSSTTRNHCWATRNHCEATRNHCEATRNHCEATRNH